MPRSSQYLCKPYLATDGLGGHILYNFSESGVRLRKWDKSSLAAWAYCLPFADLNRVSNARIRTKRLYKGFK